MLEAAGWTQDRTYDTSDWVKEIADQGCRINPAASAALMSFGGLEVEPLNAAGPNFSNDEALVFDPIAAGSGHYVLAEELNDALGGEWYPIGEWLSHSSVFVAVSGWTVATGLEWVWELGDSVNDAIEFAVMAHRPLKYLSVLFPNVAPWLPDVSGT